MNGDFGEGEANKQTRLRMTLDNRFDSRIVDLQAPSHASSMGLQNVICQLFREYLCELGFNEIDSPKLIVGALEGRSDVFKLDYVECRACIAQSPQPYN